MRDRRFIATVNRPETQKKLKRTFAQLGQLGGTVQVRTAGHNVEAVKEADVILLWFASFPSRDSHTTSDDL